MITKYLRLKWKDMDDSHCGMGAPDEDYSLLYLITYPDSNRSAEQMLRLKIPALIKEYFDNDPDADRLAVDDYIIQHINDGGYGITMYLVNAETIEIE